MFQKMLNFFVFGEDRKASNRKRSKSEKLRSFGDSIAESYGINSFGVYGASSTSKVWPR